MITLHEAIRQIQDELIKSQREREQRGIPPLFETEKMTIEFSCVFSENSGTDTKGGISALSVLTLDTSLKSSVSAEKIQKVILEFKTLTPAGTADPDQLKGEEGPGSRGIPSHHSDDGRYPHSED